MLNGSFYVVMNYISNFKILKLKNKNGKNGSDKCVWFCAFNLGQRVKTASEAKRKTRLAKYSE